MAHKNELKGVIQLIGAAKWEAVFKSEGSENEEQRPLCAWGLTRGGDVVPLVPDIKGVVSFAADDPNFLRVQHEEFRYPPFTGESAGNTSV